MKRILISAILLLAIGPACQALNIHRGDKMDLPVVMPDFTRGEWEKLDGLTLKM